MNKKIPKKKNITPESSFTFIELLAAIIVLAIGVLSVIAVSAKSYYAISLQKNKLIATNLAREGIELVKNVRNENWLYTNSSYCNLDTAASSCPQGRIKEDNSDCDWRCGSKDKAPDNDNFFRLEQGWSYSETNYFLKNLDYNFNVAKTSEAVPANITCEDHGAWLDLDASGFYAYPNDPTSSGKFKRLIQINRADLNGDGNPNNDLQIIVTVCWQERGGVWEKVWVEEHLFNWYKPE